MKKVFFTFFVFCLLPFVLIEGCSDNPSESDNLVTFSGTVTLEGETDHSGVKISLYRPVELDTALVRINQKYPNIGIQISQETEFDHREHSPLYSTTTNASGSWKIEDVTPGTYNVVAEKDSFGWRYKYETSGSGIDFDTLYQALYLNGIISSTVTANVKQFLIIESDVIFTDNSELNLEGENTILITNNKKLSILGNLSMNATKYLVITSQDIQNLGRGLVVDTDGQFNFNNLYVSYLSHGITFETNVNLNIEINESIIKNCTNNGIYAKNNYINIENNIFYNLNEYAVESLQNFDIQNNIFITSNGIVLFDNLGTVKNNLFESNRIGITPYKGDIIIRNNDFDKNDVAIAVNSSDCEITLNNFYKNGIDIELNRNYVQYPIIDFCDPNIYQNNFFNSDTAVSIFGEHSFYASGFYPAVGIEKDISIPNCFWNSSNTYNIDKKINDAIDKPEYKYYILYDPYESSVLPNAGITN
jgi:hypothetical protein